MSNGRTHSTETNQRTTTVLRDINGEIILEIGLEEYIVREADGSITFYRRSDNILLADFVEFNPGMLVGNTPVLIGVCQQCRTFSVSLFRRQRPTHGIVTLARSKLCSDCGILCCPQHRKLGSDQRWRCLPCAKKYTAKQFIKSIFWSE